MHVRAPRQRRVGDLHQIVVDPREVEVEAIRFAVEQTKREDSAMLSIVEKGVNFEQALNVWGSLMNSDLEFPEGL